MGEMDRRMILKKEAVGREGAAVMGASEGLCP